jgi:hypothetical protein
MALTKCKECSKELSTTAKACPHCGAEPPKRTSLLTWLVAIIIAYIVFSCAGRLDTTQQIAMTPAQQLVEEETARQSDAKWECKSAVKNAMEAPSTAEFPDYHTFRAINEPGGTYSVDGYVDAQNSFGAKIRSVFTCVVKKNASGGWSVETLNMVP